MKDKETLSHEYCVTRYVAFYAISSTKLKLNVLISLL